MNDETVIIEELNIEEEDSQEEISDNQIETNNRRIYTSISDPTIKDLFDRYKDGDLILQPEFQRYFVWDNTKSNKLIESVILDVPLPIIYLAEEQNGRESVIDGQQRLTTFFDFLDGKFALSGLQVRKDLNKSKFLDLEKSLQNKIRRASIRAITIQKESDKDLKFEIFERLNTGSVALNNQELRNCVYRGNYNKLLRTLAADDDFLFLLGLTQPEKRMRDVELVLRFAAFYHSTYLKYRPPIKKFLNDDMDRFKNIQEKDAQELQKVFKNSVQIIRSLLGEHAFKRYRRGFDGHPNGYWEAKQFNASLYDILMNLFTDYDKNQVMPHLDSIREALIYLMSEDQDFINSIELSTSTVSAVRTRFDKWRKVLEQIIGTPRTEPRCFTRKLKEELFLQDSTCSICSQKINDVDDSAVDHIEQYWTGGKTIPENARLTHRYCNWSRPRNE